MTIMVPPEEQSLPHDGVLPPGGGGMGALIRSFDWDSTPLGNPRGWPQNLVSALAICLDASFPVSLGWGKDNIALYNDATMAMLGDKHPAALGRAAREVWPEIWDMLEPVLAHVMTSGEAWSQNDGQFLIRRHGYLEETYCNLNISPIRGGGGSVEGTFNVVTETTSRVLRERRTHLLYQLVQHAALAQSIEETCKLSAEALEKGNADIAFSMIYLLDRGPELQRARLIATTGVEMGGAASPLFIGLSPDSDGESVWPFARVLEKGRPIVVKDLAQRCPSMPGGCWPEAPHTAVVAPLHRNFETEAPTGFIVLGVSPRRPLDEAYMKFMELAVDGVASAIANVEDREQERQWTASLSARSAIDASLDPLVTISVMGKITDANDATARATGIPREQLVGRDFASCFTEPEEAAASYREALNKGFVTNFPLAIRHHDGAVRDVLCNASVYHDELGNVAGIFAAARDVTELKDAERTLKRINRALAALSTGNQVMIHAETEQELLDRMCQVIVDTGYRMAFIGFAEQDEARTVRVAACAGHNDGFTTEAKFTWADDEYGRGDTGCAIRTGKPQQVEDTLSNPRSNPWRKAFQARGYCNSVSLPLSNAAGVFGVLTMYSFKPRVVDANEMNLLVELAEDLAFGIGTMRARKDHEHSAQRLQQSMEATVQALSATLEMRDPYTAGHQRRVAQLAVAIARKMQLSEDRIQGIYLAGIIHDIGKIQVPSEILSKPGRLSPLELALVRAHVTAGYEILKNITFPWPIADMVHQHHERLDGTGYPNKLKGDEILLEGRIIAVADVVEAISAHRPYRAALGIDLAIREIESGRGTIYDAEVVDVCLSVLRDDGFTFGEKTATAA